MGSWGLIESGSTVIHQLTGIVHPPPPASVVALLELIAAKPIRPAPGLVAKLLSMPGLGRRFLRARNWMQIDDASGALAATWHSAEAMSRLTIPGPADEPSPRSAKKQRRLRRHSRIG
ncbi:hypothetical protein [Azospirillum sp. SYSU D00513]|uniref:hypothetical protein n=1 Tax=Azospirillum sp. SYSU D00513 TaxID=2812561 RepID=UPI001A97C5B0|nr:hypothetical protein [Azospirillum sp. SYSU D00513]